MSIIEHEAVTRSGHATPYGLGRKFPLAYSSWRSMRNSRPWDYYGSRGITVCDAWRNSFACFLSDMGDRPSLRHTIERVDNDLPYEPGNCKWATMQEQCNNRRTSRLVEYQGKTMTLAEWSRTLGITYAVLRTRIHRGERGDKLFRPVEPNSGRFATGHVRNSHV